MHLFKAVQECVVGCYEDGPEFSGAENAGNFFATRAAHKFLSRILNSFFLVC
jgi:hypothetical protein